MNKEIINTEVEFLLETISDQYRHINTHQGQIPRIELDIILTNISKLYEQLLFLKKISLGDSTSHASSLQIEMPLMEIPGLNRMQAMEETETSKEKSPIVSFVVRPSFVTEAAAEAAPAEPVAEKAQASVPEIEIAPVVAELKPVVQELAPLPAVEAVNETVVQKQLETHREEIMQHQAATRKPAPASMGLFDSVSTVAGKYEEQPTLRDKISRNHTDSSLGKKYQKKAVEDLKRSIGINEKFSFINELFEGDLANYNKAIDVLNQSGSLEEAWVFIKGQLMPKYAWREESKSFLNLKDLLERRFQR